MDKKPAYIVISTFGVNSPASVIYKAETSQHEAEGHTALGDAFIALGRKLYEGRNEGKEVIAEIRNAYDQDDVIVHVEESNLVATKGARANRELPADIAPLVKRS